MKARQSVMRISITLLSLVLFTCRCLGQEPVVPKGYSVLDVKNGDLDQDGIEEKVIVYNTSDSTEFGTVREIQILKKSGASWLVWRSSRNAVLKSAEGGMMGDPFREIQIDNGVLKISLAGGSSWKWAHTDKYSFRNGSFELIGHTSIYGKPCEYWGEIDFNLITGRLVYKKEYEHCAGENYEDEEKDRKPEAETFYKKGLRLNLDNRNLESIRIVSPIHKYELYL